MRVLLYLLLLSFTSGALACISAKPVLPKLNCKCGRPRATRHKRIVGGHEASKNEFPWMVSISYAPTGAHMCGGTLLSDRTVLTAAHCFLYNDPGSYKVTIGEHNLKKDDGQTEYAVESFEYHHNLVDTPYYVDYDYAVIQLKDSVKFTDTVYSICLPKDGRYDDNRDNVIGIGWGYTTSDENVPADVLQKATFKTAAHVYECSVLGKVPVMPWWFIAWYSPEKRTDRMLCVPGTEIDEWESTIVRVGDSGGPFMVEVNPGQQNAYYVQIGIMSFNDKESYSVGARVSNQIDWIKDRIKGSVCDNPAEDDDAIIDL